MLDDYVGEIIKIPTRRIRWGIVILSFCSLLSIASNIVGWTTYSITASLKEAKINETRSKLTDMHRGRNLANTRYYQTAEGMKEQLREVQEKVREIQSSRKNQLD